MRPVLRRHSDVPGIATCTAQGFRKPNDNQTSSFRHFVKIHDTFGLRKVVVHQPIFTFQRRGGIRI
jgi:hypothetical protein